MFSSLVFKGLVLNSEAFFLGFVSVGQVGLWISDPFSIITNNNLADAFFKLYF